MHLTLKLAIMLAVKITAEQPTDQPMTTLSQSLSPVIAPSQYVEIEDTSGLQFLNPDLAQRKTAKIRLSNGLEAYLISDPQADQSSASVAVKTGSWNDPEEYPGMAHFCEHMLFMGTIRFPKENGFSSLIADYSGQMNAFTAPDRTVYLFAAWYGRLSDAR